MRTYSHYTTCNKSVFCVVVFFPVHILPKAGGVHLLSSCLVVCGKLIGLLSGALLVQKG